MHDIRFIRDHPAAFDAGLRKRNLPPLSAELLAIDKRRRAAISESEAAQARRKALSRQIGIAKGKGEVHAAAAPFVKELKDDEAEIENLKVVTTKTEQVFLVRISQVQVIALGENGTPGTIVTVCQTVIVEITQIIVTVTVQPPSGGEGDDILR